MRSTTSPTLSVPSFMPCTCRQHTRYATVRNMLVLNLTQHCPHEKLRAHFVHICKATGQLASVFAAETSSPCKSRPPCVKIQRPNRTRHVQTQLAGWALMTSALSSTYALRKGLPPTLAAPFLACVTHFACRGSVVVSGSTEKQQAVGKLPGSLRSRLVSNCRRVGRLD